jgi:hypothetical protein
VSQSPVLKKKTKVEKECRMTSEGNSAPKERHDGEFPGFSFPSCIPETELKKHTHTKKKTSMLKKSPNKSLLSEGAEWVIREGVGAGGRNDPSLVCTYE